MRCVVNRTRHLKDWGRSLWIWMYEWICEVLSMLSECLGVWVFRQGELALSSIKRRVWLGVWMDARVSDSSANTASVANTWVNCPYNYAALWGQTYVKSVTRCRDSRTAKIKKQGRDDHVKQSSIQTHNISNTSIMDNDPCGGLLCITCNNCL